MKKRDFLLIAAVLAVAFVIFVIMNVFAKKPGDNVVVKVDGKEYGTYPLSDDNEIVIDNAYGKNVLVIEAGKCYMKDADCRDGICVRHRPIDRSGDTIICLPHKLVAEITAGADSNPNEEIDATTR